MAALAQRTIDGLIETNLACLSFILFLLQLCHLFFEGGSLAVLTIERTGTVGGREGITVCRCSRCSSFVLRAILDAHIDDEIGVRSVLASRMHASHHSQDSLTWKTEVDYSFQCGGGERVGGGGARSGMRGSAGACSRSRAQGRSNMDQHLL